MEKEEMKNERNIPSIDKSLGNFLEALFAPEFYSAFNPKNFPPYNITRITGEDSSSDCDDVYRVDIALAGYAPHRLSVSLDGNVLYVTASDSFEDSSNIEVLYRGISSRAFELRFKLNIGIQVDNVRFENGILSVILKKGKPNRIDFKIKL
jgi:HSP20 family molecular chaperone IbpA